jgi:hypothetical protein
MKHILLRRGAIESDDSLRSGSAIFFLFWVYLFDVHSPLIELRISSISATLYGVVIVTLLAIGPSGRPEARP